MLEPMNENPAHQSIEVDLAEVDLQIDASSSGR